MRRLWVSLWEIAEVVIISFAAVFIIRHFLVQPFLVSGASMEPNFSNGNYLLIDELTYRFRDPERGEVVVFRYPKEPDTFFIKRIIGVPGDRVVVKDNRVFVYEGDALIELTESYLGSGAQTSGLLDVRLGAYDYFVMGDNRAYSFDSRSWGPVSRDHIVGLARVRVFPLTEMELFR